MGWLCSPSENSLDGPLQTLARRRSLQRLQEQHPEVIQEVFRLCGINCWHIRLDIRGTRRLIPVGGSRPWLDDRIGIPPGRDAKIVGQNCRMSGYVSRETKLAYICLPEQDHAILLLYVSRYFQEVRNTQKKCWSCIHMPRCPRALHSKWWRRDAEQRLCGKFERSRKVNAGSCIQKVDWNLQNTSWSFMIMVSKRSHFIHLLCLNSFTLTDGVLFSSTQACLARGLILLPTGYAWDGFAQRTSFNLSNSKLKGI